MTLKDNTNPSNSFGSQFKQLRLQAGISTLKELGNILAEYGYSYEDSVFSHWQAGRKFPTKRKVLLTLLRIFSTKGGIQVDQANNFLKAAGQGYLTEDETENIITITSKKPFYVPPQIPSFVARSEEMENVIQDLKENHTVYIAGPAGIGKTALAIEIAYKIKNDYPDGILWYRVDTSDISQILNSIANVYGENVNSMQDIEIKASMVRSLLSAKDALLILDNIETSSQLHLLLQNSSDCDVLITTKHKDIIPASSQTYLLQPFEQNEVLLFYSKVLGEDYIKQNTKNILEISEFIGNLPLGIAILAKDLYLNKDKILHVKQQLIDEGVDLNQYTYDNKNLKKAYDVAVKTLTDDAQNLFFSLGVFSGKDFSLPAIAYINNISDSKAESILNELINRCLVETSINERFRLHPTIARFIKAKDVHNKFIKPLANFFLAELEKGDSNQKEKIISHDFDNINALFEACYKAKYISPLFNLWEVFGIYLWNKGYWSLYRNLGLIVYETADDSEDDVQKMKCCLRDLGWCYYWQGNIDEAEKYISIGLSIANKLNDQEWIAFGSQRLSKIYQAKKQYSESNNLFESSLSYFSRYNLYEKVGDTLTYIGENYWLQKDLPKAKYYLEKALDMVNKINDLPQKAIVLSNLAGVAFVNKDYNKSQKYFEESIAIADQLKRNAGGYFWNNLGLGILQFEIGNFDKSKEFLYKAKQQMAHLGIEEKTFNSSVFFVAMKEQILKTRFYTEPANKA